jgi:hypothetical protein
VRVVDAATGKPSKGALVMVVWQAEDTEIDGMKNVVAIREVATGADGGGARPGAQPPDRGTRHVAWAGLGPGCAVAAAAADLLDQFLGEQLERLGFRERGASGAPRSRDAQGVGGRGGAGGDRRCRLGV